MRIISWNVNGLKSHLKPEKWQYLNDLIKNYDPDILLMQETKLSENDEHKYKIYEKFKDYSFDNVKSPKKGYAGVASLIKSSAMKLGEKTFGVNGDFGKISFASDIKFPDTILNGRCLTYELGDIYLVNTYVQNSGDGLKNLLYRDKIWDKKMKEYLDELESKKPVIWAGDLNVAHHEIDLANPEKNRNNTAGFTDTERNNFTDMIENRVDAFRHINGNEVKYSYWSNFNNARNKNIGWRIDYFILSESLKDKIKSCDILTDVKGSDHAPIIMDIDL
jgi:exodeoxyribonuclease III